MALQVAVPRETESGEKRVAMSPRVAERFVKMGITVLVETGAGAGSGMQDADYSKFATLVEDAGRLYGEADIVLRVQVPEAAHIRLMREGALLASFVNGGQHLEQVKLLRDKKITTLLWSSCPESRGPRTSTPCRPRRWWPAIRRRSSRPTGSGVFSPCSPPPQAPSGPLKCWSLEPAWPGCRRSLRHGGSALRWKVMTSARPAAKKWNRWAQNSSALRSVPKAKEATPGS